MFKNTSHHSDQFCMFDLARIAAFPKGNLCLQLHPATFHCQANVLSTTSLEVCFLAIWCLYYNNIYIITCANMQCGKEEYKKTALSVANRLLELNLMPCPWRCSCFYHQLCLFAFPLGKTAEQRHLSAFWQTLLQIRSAYLLLSICPQLSFSCTSDQHNIRKTTRRILFSTTVVLIYTSKTTFDHNGLRNATITYTVNHIQNGL